MSDYYETSLRRYEEELDQRYQEEYERATNPKFYWHIIAKNDHLLPEWEEWADSEEETNGLIQSAKDDGFHYSCTKHIEGGQY